MDKLLLIDDDRAVRLLVEKGLSSDDLRVYAAENATIGIRLLEKERPQVALVDVMLPEISGLELFHKIRAFDSKIPIIFVTSDNSSETTIQCMRIGAFDYLPKPINLDQLRVLIGSALKSRRLMDQPVGMPVSNATAVGESFVGGSQLMLEVFKSIGRVAAQNVAVLVRGESGCGKELVARAVVQHSDRNQKPFLSVTPPASRLRPP